jgi:TetR/AcrR family transcriptional regulator, tetracycline repressor protein
MTGVGLPSSRVLLIHRRPRDSCYLALRNFLAASLNDVNLSSKRKSVSKSGGKLDRESILKAAFSVLSKKGLDGLSLRVLASRLGVQAPAIYWHVHNKAELIGMMAATFSAAAAKAVPAEETWSSRLIAYGQALRQSMLLHRDAARLCASAQPIEDPEANAQRVAAPLVAAGLDTRQALSCQSSVIAYTLGWVVYEQSRKMHDHLAQMLDLGESFEFGLRAMVRGFVAEIDGKTGSNPKQQKHTKLLKS